MKPIGVLVNPAANRGRGNQVGEQVFSQLAKAGIPAINLSAESAIAAAKKAQVAISDQEISGVIAVGGDGTTQLGVNICVPNQIPLGIVPAGSGKPADAESVQAALAQAQREVQGRGRAFLRASGTEPVVRVTVEADDAGLMRQVLERLADVVRAAT